MLRLRTFGGLSIENGASIGGAPASRRPLALLALLAVKGRRGLSRDTIVALLWPDSDADRGRNSLSQVISVLRRELGADHVLLGAAELRVNPDVLACDVMEFEQRIAADDLEAAATLYTGPFLDGVFLKNTPEFERWVDEERSRLQLAYGDVLERLAARATAAGDNVAAVRFWRQRASLTPSDSRTAHKLMESLVASGDPAGALGHYRVHQALLRDDVGRRAGCDTRGVRDDVARGERPLGPQHHPGSRRAFAASITLRDDPAHHNALEATAVRSPTRRRVLLAWVAAAVVVIGIAWAFVAKSGRFGPPEPPAHDSLRLRIVTALLTVRPRGRDASAPSTRCGARRDGAGSMAVRRDAVSVDAIWSVHGSFRLCDGADRHHPQIRAENANARDGRFWCVARGQRLRDQPRTPEPRARTAVSA